MSVTIPTINSPANSYGYTNTANPTLSGTAPAFTSVQVLNNGNQVLGTTTSDANGAWQYTLATPLYQNVRYSLTAKTLDVSSTTLASSPAVSFFVDTTAPTAPTFDLGVNNGVNSYGFITGTNPTLGGYAEAGSTVEVFVDGLSLGKITSAGHWSIPVTTALNDGIHSAKANAVDRAGNLSVFSNPLTFSVDTQAPAAPTMAERQIAAGNIRPFLSGTAELHSTVEVFDGTRSLGRASVDANGYWGLTVGPLEKGNYVLHAKATDSQSNVSFASNPVTFLVGDTVVVNGLNITATSAAEHLTGDVGDNVIVGNGGGDTIDGGSGIDTVVFSGDLANFTLTRAGSACTIRNNTGAGGTDAVTDVESLKFADKTVNLTVQSIAAAAPQADVQRLEELYVAFFNRVPDADGLAYWIRQMSGGQSINQIAEAFYNAGVQYSSLTGFSAGMSNADFVNVVYKNVLGRTAGADADGLAYWGGELASGRATHGSLVSTILSSAHTYKGDATWGWVADLLDNKVAVANKFAVEWGLNYNTPDDSISHGMAIAAAVTAMSTVSAISLIGVSANDIHLV